MQIAAMTSVFYSKRNTREKTPAAESVRRLKNAGFSHIDLNLCGMGRGEQEFCGDDWEKQAEALRNEAEKLGVTFVQSHAPYYREPADPADREEYGAYFERMLLRSASVSRIMGIRYSVVHPLEDPLADPTDKEAHLARTEKVHRAFMEKAAGSGIAPAFENMADKSRAGRFCAGADDLIMLCGAFAEYRAGVCWDFGHAHLSWDDQCGQIGRLAGRVLCVHTHDNKGKNDDHLMPFMGSIPWEAVLHAMRRTGFGNDLVLEVAQNANMPDELKDESALLMARASGLLIRMFEA